MKGILATFIMLFGLNGLSFGQSDLCYKDLCIGMDEKEGTSLLDGTHESYKLPEEKKKEIFDDCNRLQMSHNVPSCIEKETLHLKLEKYDKIGEVRVYKPKLEFHGGKLADIVVRLRDVSDWEKLRNALFDKWGKPDKTSKEEYQNRMGAKFYRIVDLWFKKEGVIHYSINPGRGEEYVYYIIKSKELADKMIKETKDEKSKVKKGL